jgi:hypothetical protein
MQKIPFLLRRRGLLEGRSPEITLVLMMTTLLSKKLGLSREPVMRYWQAEEL